MSAPVDVLSAVVANEVTIPVLSLFQTPFVILRPCIEIERYNKYLNWYVQIEQKLEKDVTYFGVYVGAKFTDETFKLCIRATITVHIKKSAKDDRREIYSSTFGEGLLSAENHAWGISKLMKESCIKEMVSQPIPYDALITFVVTDLHASDPSALILPESQPDFDVDSTDFNTVIHVDSRSLFVHSFVLCTSSKFFAKLYKNDKEVEETNKIDLHDEDYEDLKRLLLFIYPNCTQNISIANVESLCRMADKFICSTLLFECTTYIKNNITKQNACMFYFLAKTYLHSEALSNLCLNTIKQIKFDIIYCCPYYKNLDIGDRLDLAEKILREDTDG